jgi:hypothetical protein
MTSFSAAPQALAFKKNKIKLSASSTLASPRQFFLEKKGGESFCSSASIAWKKERKKRERKSASATGQLILLIYN